MNGSIDDLARLNRPEGLQKTYLDNYAQTRQTQKATIRREYTPDTTNGINTDLIVYEEGSYVTRFVYGYERISQTTFDYPNKTERGIEGWNPSTDVSTEDVDKVYTHTYKNGSTAYTTDQLGRTRHYAEYGDWGNILTPEQLEMNYSGIDNVNPYTVHEYDTVLDKYFAQYRLYDAGNKRFVAKDPVKSGLNWYEYTYVTAVPRLHNHLCYGKLYHLRGFPLRNTLCLCAVSLLLFQLVLALLTVL